MSFNLPDGMSTNDLPGCTPMDEFCTDYFNDRVDDMDEFHGWLEDYLDSDVRMTEKALRALWQFDDVFTAYEAYLEEKAAQAWAERG